MPICVLSTCCWNCVLFNSVDNVQFVFTSDQYWQCSMQHVILWSFLMFVVIYIVQCNQWWNTEWSHCIFGDSLFFHNTGNCAVHHSLKVYITDRGMCSLVIFIIVFYVSISGEIAFWQMRWAWGRQFSHWHSSMLCMSMVLEDHFLS